jgi:hypothetical protein
MLSLLAATIMIGGQDIAAKYIKLPEPGNKPKRLSLYVNEIPLDPPKFAPKLFGDPPDKWQFDWVASAYGPDPDAPKDPKTGEQQANIRFRVFSQIKKRDNDYTVLVAQQAIRMWDILTSRYRIGHSQAVNLGIIDYYLCFGGQAGGEYLRGEDVDPKTNRAMTVSTIYIYDVRSFSKPIEMAREVAHEYGHAVFPPVGGYTSPEYWANGYLGEKLMMRQLRDRLASNLIFPPDVMNCTLPMMETWVKQNVDPMVIKASSSPPNIPQLADKGKPGMDAYIGLVLYADTIFPPNVVTRSMYLMGSQDAKDYPDSLLRAVQEPDRLTLSIPAYLKNKPIWIPLGKSKIAQAQVLKRDGDWAQVLPQAGGVVITTVRG